MRCAKPAAPEPVAAQKSGPMPLFCRLVVAIDFLAAFVALLRLDRQGGDRTGIEALQRDRLSRFLAITVGAFIDALQGGIDLGDQLALAITGAKLDRAVG